MSGTTTKTKSRPRRILERMSQLPFCALRFSANLIMLSWPLVVSVESLATPFAQAQRGPVQRIVQGRVTDKGNAAISGAVVYLKDDHSLSVKSFISEADGSYRFGQLLDGTDYELWAESNGKKSSTKTISSFDSKRTFQIDLKIDTAK